MKTPVIFLIFNRPDTTEKVFDTIRQAKPEKLLVVADGFRAERIGEDLKCAETRAIIEKVDWKCEVLTNYSDVNLGCKARVSSGLDWAFNQVEEAIILEDDCVPDPTFFQFCEELLERYRDDERIAVISGDNFQFGLRRTEYSYYFSRYNHCWGWATWRRAWQHYDVEMKSWTEIRDRNALKCILEEPAALKYWHQVFQRTYEEKINSWAYRWTFACWLQSGLTILPSKNLVTNIGFHGEATHTKDKESLFANLTAEVMHFPMKHPSLVMRHVEADNFFQRSLSPPTYPRLITNKLKKILHL